MRRSSLETHQLCNVAVYIEPAGISAINGVVIQQGRDSFSPLNQPTGGYYGI